MSLKQDLSVEKLVENGVRAKMSNWYKMSPSKERHQEEILINFLGIDFHRLAAKPLNFYRMATDQMKSDVLQSISCLVFMNSRLQLTWMFCQLCMQSFDHDRVDERLRKACSLSKSGPII